MKITQALFVAVLAFSASAAPLPAPIAEPAPALDVRQDGSEFGEWCGTPGHPCRRDAAPEPAPIAEPEPEPLFKWCGHPGQPCGRDAAPDPALEVREPEASLFKWCGHPGQPCG